MLQQPKQIARVGDRAGGGATESIKNLVDFLTYALGPHCLCVTARVHTLHLLQYLATGEFSVLDAPPIGKPKALSGSHVPMGP